MKKYKIAVLDGTETKRSQYVGTTVVDVRKRLLILSPHGTISTLAAQLRGTIAGIAYAKDQ